jgi:hypothetical protein
MIIQQRLREAKKDYRRHTTLLNDVEAMRLLGVRTLKPLHKRGLVYFRVIKNRPLYLLTDLRWAKKNLL